MKHTYKFAQFVFWLLTALISNKQIYAQCHDWVPIGFPGTSIEESFNGNSIVIDNNDIQYAAFSDHSNSDKITVKKYVSGAWVTVGSAGFSDGVAGDVTIALDTSGTPFVAYRDDAHGGRITVKKFNGSSWVTVGSAGFTPNTYYGSGNTQYITLAVCHDGNPIVTGYGLNIYKYNGSSWVTLGTPFLNANYFPRLAVNKDGVPYFIGTDNIAFQWYTTLQLIVARYNGTDWESVGTSPGTTTGGVAIAFDSTGLPYIAYADSVEDGKLTVEKFNGSTWSLVGTAGFSPTTSWASVSLALDTSGIPYVTYENQMTIPGFSEGNYCPNVMKYNGSSWELVGFPDFIRYSGHAPTVLFNSENTPYFASISGGGVNTFRYIITTLHDITYDPGLSVFTGNTINMFYEGYSVGSTWGFGVGAWEVSDTTIASLSYDEPLTFLTGVSAGTVTITYHASIDSGCLVTNVVSVNAPTAGTITGSVSMYACSAPDGGILTSSIGGGVWSTNDTAVANVWSYGSMGIVTYVAAGTATISYTVTQGYGSVSATVTTIATINPAPDIGVITGPVSVCVGDTIVLSDTATTPGVWVTTSGNASVTSTGVVYGIEAGTAVISYISTICDPAAAIATVTVTTSADAGTITGTPTLCVGNTTTLSNAIGGGTWSSSNTSVANIGTSGVVSGISPGTATISYSVTSSCGSAVATLVVTVNTGTGVDPGTITGTPTVCTGSTTALSNAVSGGTWSSSNISIATVGTTGIVTGVSSGNATITYTVSGGSCGTAFTTQAVTVSATPGAGTITGTATVCTGATTTLSNATSGGVWSSGSTGIATVGTSGVVSGVSAGNASISYSVTNGCGTAVATKDVTVNTTPSVAAITGTATVCTGATTTLSNATSGGVWSSGSTGIATVGTSGVVSGVSAGNATISYSVTNSCGTTVATQDVTVNTTPGVAAITGTASVCTGATTTLSDATSGGVWSSGSTGVATVGTGGVVSGVSAGNATISYSVTNGCGTAVATRAVTVNALPGAGSITGASTVNVGATTTLSDAVSGGVWSSSATGIATVGTGGVVTGVSAGNVTISYTITNGCGSATATKAMTVNATSSPITGTFTVCVGSTTTLSHATPGGMWTSGNTSVATVGASTGIVTGISAGTALISYYVSGSYVMATVTVNPLPATISGAANVCLSATTTLTDATSGGTWSSNNATIASVDAGGVVTGVAVGNTTITYTLGTGCYRTKVMTVSPLPAAITGTASVCVGNTTSLTNSTSGGTSWTSSAPSVATVGSSNGVVSGVAAGNTTITYTVSTGCYATREVTVNALPAVITGTTFICAGGATTTLNTTPAGGTWASSNTAMATVGSATGVVTSVPAVTGGSVNITYTLATSCRRVAAVSVGTMPAAITGSLSLCIGGTTTLSSATAGCTWSSGTLSVATIGTSGIVSGVAAGTSTISYTHASTCARSTVVSVTAAPAAITGTFTVCAGATVTLSDATSGGTWSSSNATIATINSATGLVTGKAAGTTNITYSVGSGCTVYAMVTVNAAVANITGTLNVCVGSTTALSSTTSGGAWTSSNNALGTVSGTGVVTGISAGTPTISYTVNGCFKTANVTVKALPAAIAGNAAVCIGGTSTLTCPSPVGVSWTSSAPTIASIGVTSGVMTGVAAGNATITYLNNTGCKSTRQVTVSAAPSAGVISGPNTVIIGNNITLSSTVGGGTWTSANAAIASVGAGTGIVLGVSAGGPIDITYTANNGCGSTFATYGVEVTSSRPGGQGTVAGGSVVFKVFPNPTSGSLTLESPVKGVFSVNTIDGRMVAGYNITETTTLLSLPNTLASGIYMCRFNGDDGSTVMVRLVYEH